MELHFISRREYRQKQEPAFLERLEVLFGRFYLLPEGGTNLLAVKGCSEILQDEDRRYDVICCAVGTGGTLSGIINASDPGQELIGFPVLKGGHLKKDICSFADKDNWRLEWGYHFGGYAKINESLIAFINSFRNVTGLPLDPIYTGKLFYGILDLAQRNTFRPGTRILAIHTGGLQGIAGMNRLLEKKKLPLIRI
jgi:1-aminocyclopropane-1-carboxylate deaminase